MKFFLLILSLFFSSAAFSNTYQCQIFPGDELLRIKTFFGSPDVLEIQHEDSQIPSVMTEGKAEVKDDHVQFFSNNQIFAVNIFIDYHEGMMMIGPRVFQLLDCQEI